MKETEWEVVGEDLDRQPVPGGWVYRTTSTYAHGDAVAVALAYVTSTCSYSAPPPGSVND